MANHRAERRTHRPAPEPPGATPDPTPEQPGPTPGATAGVPVAPRSHRGDHRAGRRRAVPASGSTHAGARRAAPGGARKAAHAGQRKKLLPAIPSAPTLAGAAVLALAATGALTLSHTPLTELGSGGITRLSAEAHLSSGVQPLTSGADRQQRPSRGAARSSLQDAQDRQLVAAADAQARQRDATLEALAASAQRHADALAWHLPVARGSYVLTARFGEVSGLWAHVHTGLDFAGPVGTPIMAVADGVITSTGWAGAYGNRTVETLPDGTELWYCHQNGFNVDVGQHVTEGQVIGYIGATGNTTGPHLHLEVRPGGGDPVDPYTALLQHGVQP